MSEPPSVLPTDVQAALESLAGTRYLLVASDFDGTMAPLVDDPAAARALPASEQALNELARLPRTTAAVVSGRSLKVLRRLTKVDDLVHLVGSHGMEFDASFGSALPPSAHRRLAAINTLAESLATRFAGLTIEQKPASTALHYRHVPSGLQSAVIHAIRTGPCAVAGAHVTGGKFVVEVAAIETSKGHALDRLRSQVGASSVAFIGDDATDENAFVTLSGQDVGVKVGNGPTAAGVRIPDTAAVATFLAELSHARRRFVTGSQSKSQ